LSAAGVAGARERRRTSSSRSRNRTGLDGHALGRVSRLVAKVDSAAVRDGYELYLHGFIVTDDGKWVVVQQGINGETRYARRYHWLSEGVASFVEVPHAAIHGRNAGEIVNLTDRRAAASRVGQVELLHALWPGGIVREAALLAAGKPAPFCDYAASGSVSIWSRRNCTGERWPWRSISQCSL
jgi:uncharacterized protein